MSILEQPGLRNYSFLASVNSSIYVWGGLDYNPSSLKREPVDIMEYIYKFNTTTGAWDRLRLKNQHPPGLYDGACVGIGENIYFYGGYDTKGQRTGSLYELNLTTLTWQALSSPGVGSPKKRSGCHMVEYEGTLVMYGGVTAEGHSNELHVFNLATGEYTKKM